MQSGFPSIPSSDGLFPMPFPATQSGFPSWDWQESFFDFQHHEPIFLQDQTQELVLSNCGSDNWNPIIPLSPNSGSDNSNPIIPLSPNSGSDELNPNKANLNSGWDEMNRDVSIVDERKQRRMISNRESARRSRIRKQKHLENLRNQLNRLRVSNRELLNRLHLATNYCQLVGNDNDRLLSEASMLRRKLWDIRQVLHVRQLQQQLASSAWPCSSITSINEQIPQSLIT